MEDLLLLVIRVLFWPFLWWRNHNQYSRLGTSPDEEETEQFWLRFALCGVILALSAALAVHLWHPDWRLPR